MLFTELRFLVFLLIAYVVYWSLRSNGPRKLWLLACSYAFYAGWDWRFLGLILASTLVDYVVGLLLQTTDSRGRRRLLLLASLGVNLGALGFFKYFNFFVESGAELFDWLGIHVSSTTLQITLPVGISFYTFQTLSYTIDIYRGKLKPIRSLSDFALFVAFFPQLVAGPIVRASHFLPQLLEKRLFRNIEYRHYLLLFLLGYIKKACIADHFGIVVDQVFADPTAFAAAAKWLALLLYSAQIYCDFSGYSDMAIATAGLFGYRLVLNFDFPYLASSVTEFWRRWHISLSTWFRDYLYIPLGGNRGTRVRTGLNLVTVFFLCGLWHGASWNFVVWGLIHGFFLVGERIVGRTAGDTYMPLRHLYTLLVAALAWVFFRAADLGSAWEYTLGLFGLGSANVGDGTVDTFWWFLLIGFAAVHGTMRGNWLERMLARLPIPVYSVVYGAAVAVVLPWAAAHYQPFIYFQF